MSYLSTNFTAPYHSAKLRLEHLPYPRGRLSTRAIDPNALQMLLKAVCVPMQIRFASRPCFAHAFFSIALLLSICLYRLGHLSRGQTMASRERAIKCDAITAHRDLASCFSMFVILAAASYIVEWQP